MNCTYLLPDPCSNQIFKSCTFFLNTYSNQCLCHVWTNDRLNILWFRFIYIFHNSKRFPVSEINSVSGLGPFPTESFLPRFYLVSLNSDRHFPHSQKLSLQVFQRIFVSDLLAHPLNSLCRLDLSTPYFINPFTMPQINWESSVRMKLKFTGLFYHGIISLLIGVCI